MTEQQTQFLKAVIEYEVLKDQLSLASESLQTALAALPLNSFVQDEQTGIVYKVVAPKGTFVAFKQIDYVRTKKPDERQGTLSAKEAEQAGFYLKPSP